MRLSIVTPVFNNFNFTKSYLEDLSYLPEDVQVIVVNNASTDKTKELPFLDIKIPKNLKIIRNDENYGFAKASNIGFKDSIGDYVLFLNNDIRVKSNKEDWILPLLAAAEDGSVVGPTGGLLDSEFNFVHETNKIEPGHFYMSGWCLAAKRDTWNKLQLPTGECPFTEEFKTYFEDTDLGFRCRELGIPFKIVDVPVVHFGKITAKQVGISQLYSAARAKFVRKWKGK
jgi:GT2 family glycosyltransferase